MMPSRIGMGVLLAVAVWCGAVRAAEAALLISEVYYDPPGSDAGHEFLELWNPGASAVGLDDWVVEWAGDAWAAGSLALSGVVPSRGYFLIGGAQTMADFGVAPDLVASLAFQNGGTATDGVRVRHGSYTDTVLYDEPNVNGLTADPQWDGASFAPDVPSGMSVARALQMADTDTMSDFSAAAPTPMNRFSAVVQPEPPVPSPGHAPVPEPASLWMVGVGVGCLLNMQRRTQFGVQRGVPGGRRRRPSRE